MRTNRVFCRRIPLTVFVYLVITGHTVGQIQQLDAGVTCYDFRFGTSVGIFGDHILVGAPNENCGTSTNSGAVFAFERGPTGWQLSQTIKASDDASIILQYGHDVDVSATRAIIGAPQGNISPCPFQGAAYILRLDNGYWVEEAKLTSPFKAGCDQFGWSVAIDEDVAIVGAPDDTYAGADPAFCGGAHVFEREGTTWNWRFSVTIGCGIMGYAELGQCVALRRGAADGRRMAFVAEPDWAGVYIYERFGGVWVSQQHLEPFDWFTEFGASMSAYGDTLLIGAPDARFWDDGEVYVYKLSGGNWSLQQSVASPHDPIFVQDFGMSVALSEDLAMVGEPDLSASASYVHVYRRGTGFVLQQQLQAPDSFAAEFGGALALSTGDDLAIGAPGTYGKAFVQHLQSGCGPTFCGDLCCGLGENSCNCPQDCKPPYCGDGLCCLSENPCDCPADCTWSCCGNSTCEAGENRCNCAADCGPPFCGDGCCDGSESCSTCPGDCGTCGPSCGNGLCESGEDSGNCPADCGASAPAMSALGMVACGVLIAAAATLMCRQRRLWIRLTV